MVSGSRCFGRAMMPSSNRLLQAHTLKAASF
jgi:hypothetical protein